jgi:hypothetical protein
MSIEINEMVVQMQIDEESRADPGQETGIGANDLEKIKAQIIAQCRDMFYKLLDEQKER